MHAWPGRVLTTKIRAVQLVRFADVVRLLQSTGLFMTPQRNQAGQAQLPQPNQPGPNGLGYPQHPGPSEHPEQRQPASGHAEVSQPSQPGPSQPSNAQPLKPNQPGPAELSQPSLPGSADVSLHPNQSISKGPCDSQHPTGLRKLPLAVLDAILALLPMRERWVAKELGEVMIFFLSRGSDVGAAMHADRLLAFVPGIE